MKTTHAYTFLRGEAHVFLWHCFPVYYRSSKCLCLVGRIQPEGSQSMSAPDSLPSECYWLPTRMYHVLHPTKHHEHIPCHQSYNQNRICCVCVDTVCPHQTGRDAIQVKPCGHIRWACVFDSLACSAMPSNRIRILLSSLVRKEPADIDGLASSVCSYRLDSMYVYTVCVI